MKRTFLFLCVISLTGIAANKIVKLALRDYNVTLSSAGAGPLYTVETKDGRVVAKDLSEKQLQVNHPAIFESIKPALAGDSTLDASGILIDSSRQPRID